MTGEVLTLMTGLFAQFWRLFTSWHVPGTNLTPAGWFLFLLSAGVLFRFLAKLGFGRNSLDDLIRGIRGGGSGGSEKSGGDGK